MKSCIFYVRCQGITPCIELKLPMATTCSLTYVADDQTGISVTTEGNIYYWRNINTPNVDLTAQMYTLGHQPCQIQPIQVGL